VIQVHVWDEPSWAQDFADLLRGTAECTFGNSIAAGTEILIKGRPDDSEIERISSLRALIVPWAGIPEGTRELLLKHPKVGLYNLHHHAADTAEMALALYFAVAKRIIPRDSGLREGLWSEDSWVRGGSSITSTRAAGKRALVLGYGSIGRWIGKVCEAMGMEVRGVRRSGPFDDRVRPLADLDQLLPETDALFVALPLTPETTGLMTAERLRLLPKTAIISNIARGAIFNEEALYQALREERIGGAGIDVWWNYPSDDGPCFPSAFPFHELANVVMTPHVGGSSDASEEHRCRALADLVRGIADGSAKAASVEHGY
jgi:phosphoglycerate dehydrogenase-like enzyme